MARPRKVVTTAKRVLGADVIEGKGLALRFLSDDGAEHHIQLSADEAHGLADMIAIALRHLPASDQRPT